MLLFAAKSLAGELVLRIASGQIRGKRDTQEDRALLAFGGKFIEAGEDDGTLNDSDVIESGTD